MSGRKPPRCGQTKLARSGWPCRSTSTISLGPGSRHGCTCCRTTAPGFGSPYTQVSTSRAPAPPPDYAAGRTAPGVSWYFLWRFGAQTRSLRRGSAAQAELARGEIGDLTLARVLRHPFPTSSAQYVLSSLLSSNTATVVTAMCQCAAMSKGQGGAPHPDRPGQARQSQQASRQPRLEDFLVRGGGPTDPLADHRESACGLTTPCRGLSAGNPLA
jgi:hypothetical protein